MSDKSQVSLLISCHGEDVRTENLFTQVYFIPCVREMACAECQPNRPGTQIWCNYTSGYRMLICQPATLTTVWSTWKKVYRRWNLLYQTRCLEMTSA